MVFLERLIKGTDVFKATGDCDFRICFVRMFFHHMYALFKAVAFCREHFTDKEYGEWYGVLRRDGKVSQPAFKGSTVKGPFHLLRMLCMVECMIDEILKR